MTGAEGGPGSTGASEWGRSSRGVIAWVLLVCALVGFTLDNTHPYQGDETYYIKSAVGMLKAGGLLVPQHEGVIRLQKPILAYWLTALGYEVFGISLWAGRVPFLIAAAALLFVVYRFARLILIDHEAAGLAVALLSSSTLFLLFSRVSMTDMPLALFSTTALYFFCRGLLVPDRRLRDVTLAYLAMGAGFLTKGPLALMPVAAVAAWLVLAKPAGARALLRGMVAPRPLLAFTLVALPWYVYLALAYPAQLRSQFAQEAADNLGSGLATAGGHVLFYAGSLAVYQVPAAALTAWAWWKRRAIALRGPHLEPLTWYVGLSLAVFIVFFAHHRDRYLLLVIPILSVIAAHVIHQNGLTRPAWRLAAIAAVVQIAGIWTIGYTVGRPTHDLVRYWDLNLHGDLAVCGLGDRESTWALAIAGGRLVSCREGAPYVITPAEQQDRLPGYEVIARSSRASELVGEGGRLSVKEQEFVLMGPIAARSATVHYLGRPGPHTLPCSPWQPAHPPMYSP